MATTGTITTTSFQTNPVAESYTVDPYDPKELAALTAPQTPLDRDLAALETTLTDTQLLQIQQDQELQNKIKASGMTTAQYIESLERKLPPGLDLNRAAQEGVGITDIDRDLTRLKRGIESGDGSYSPSFVMSGLKWMKKAGELVDNDAYKKLLDKANEYGFGFKDEITESGILVGLLEGVLKVSARTPLWQYIEGTPLGDMYTDFVVTKVIELAASHGSYTGVKEIIDNHPKEISTELRKKCLILIFQNFRVGDEDLTEGYGPAATRITQAFEAILPGWREIYVPQQYLKDHTNFLAANEGLLAILKFDGNYYNGIAHAAAFQLDLQLVPESLTALLAKAQPGHVIEALKPITDINGDDLEEDGKGFKDFSDSVLPAL